MNKKLYVNQFTLAPLIFKSLEEVSGTNNWQICGYSEALDMEYTFWFGINESNQKLINKLKEGTEMVVYGTVKSNKNKQTILRAKQIVV